MPLTQKMQMYFLVNALSYGPISSIPTSPTPVTPPTPLTMAVYAPGGSVTSIAASWLQPVVATEHASFPVACMSCGVPQETAGASHWAIGVCQLLLVAISVCPEYSSI